MGLHSRDNRIPGRAMTPETKVSDPTTKQRGSAPGSRFAISCQKPLTAP